MNGKIKTFDKAEAKVTTRPACSSPLRIGGYFDVECRGADGELKWRETAHNIWCNSTRDDILNLFFANTGTQVTTWYIGLHTDTAAATMTTTSGITEFTDYTGNRQDWAETASSGGSGSITNASTIDFTCNATGTVNGAFLCDLATGDSNIAVIEDFGSARSVVNNDVISITYTVSCTDS